LRRQSNSLTNIDTADLTPIEYERHCAEILQQHGWDIQLTQATRDGGADFIAEKADVRLVVQCKRYNHPVGNKAVQEITSAVRLYGGNVACVVAPNGYTRQAQNEATGLSVHLLHHSALPAFADKLLS
jgi:restriction system protein